MPQLTPAALRTLQVFEIFARERRPLASSELARYLDLPNSSCSDLLFTMREAGYLLRMPKTRRLYPTARLLVTAQALVDTDPIQTLASEVLEQLTNASGESSLCGCADGGHVKIVACKESSRALRYVLQPGTMIDMHSTSLGKAILGAMPSKERDALIDKLDLTKATDHTLVSKKALHEDIKQGRKQRWYSARDEGAIGVGAIAISGVFGGIPMGFSLVGPTHRMMENRDRYVELVLSVLGDLDAENNT